MLYAYVFEQGWNGKGTERRVTHLYTQKKGKRRKLHQISLAESVAQAKMHSCSLQMGAATSAQLGDWCWHQHRPTRQSVPEKPPWIQSRSHTATQHACAVAACAMQMWDGRPRVTLRFTVMPE
jgi:hypothetical protein